MIELTTQTNNPYKLWIFLLKSSINLLIKSNKARVFWLRLLNYLQSGFVFRIVIVFVDNLFHKELFVFVLEFLIEIHHLVAFFSHFHQNLSNCSSTEGEISRSKSKVLNNTKITLMPSIQAFLNYLRLNLSSSATTVNNYILFLTRSFF